MPLVSSKLITNIIFSIYRTPLTLELYILIQAWLVGEGEIGCLVRDLVSLRPLSYKTRSACYKETLIGNAKRELVVYRVLRPYIATSFPRGVVYSSHC